MNPELVAIQMKLFGGKKVAAETAAVAGGMEGVGKAAQKSASKQSAMRAQLQRQVSTMRTIGRGMTKYLTLPVVGVGVAAGAMAIDFEHEMHNVNSIAQLPEKQFEHLQQSVLDLAGPVAQAPKTLAEGLYDLVSSGFDAHESLTILKSSALAASAGLTTSEVATKAVAATINAYQLKARDAGRISDTLFETVNRGVLSFDELASTIGDVLPFASQVGVNINELGASIATMTKAGINPAETMTRLKNVMVTLLKPGKDLSSRLKDLGTTGEDIVKKRGLQGAIELITKGMSKEQIAGLFPNIRALGGVLALTGKNAARAREDLKAFGSTAGATRKVLHEQEKSVRFQAQRAWAELQASLIELGQTILPMVIPPFMKLAHAAVSAVKWFAKLPEPIRNIGLALLALLALAGPMTLFTAALLNLRLQLVAYAATSEAVSGTTAMAGAGGLAKGMAGMLVKSIPFAFAAAGIGNTVVSAVQGDTEQAIGGAAGAALGGGIGFALGGPVGAAIGVGIGSFAGEALAKALSGDGTTGRERRATAERQHAIRATRAQARSVRELRGAEDKAGRAVSAHRRAVHAQTVARHRYSAALKNSGKNATKTKEAELALARANKREERTANAASKAHRYHGDQLRLYRRRTIEAVSAEKARIPTLRSNIRNLRQQRADGDKSTATLQKLVNRERELGDVNRKLNGIYRESSDIAGKKFSTRMKDMTTQQARFGLRGKFAKDKLKELNETIDEHSGSKVPEDIRATRKARREYERYLGILKEINETLAQQPIQPSVPQHGAGHGHGGRGHQAGGFISRSMFTMVGEAGPELVRLPGGARVYPHGAGPRGDGRVNRVQFGGSQRGGKTYLAPVVLRVGRRKLAEVMAETQEDEAARQ